MAFIESGRKPYRVHWRDDDGKQRCKTFANYADAKTLRDKINNASNHGESYNPDAGKTKLRDYAKAWLENQTFDASTKEGVEQRLRLHVYPTLGDKELRSLRPSVVQAWIGRLNNQLAPNYVRVVFQHLNTILAAAVDDEEITRNPCRAGSVKPPRPDKRKITPWTVEQLDVVRAALPARYAAMIDVGAGLGLRQGEIFGLSVADVDFLRRVVHVRRQVKIVDDALVYALPKGGKERDVPLPDTIALRLSAHLQAFPPTGVTLPWETPDGKPVEVRLIFTRSNGKAIARNNFNLSVWKPARLAAGVEDSRDNGMHVLRHTYASALLEDGVSIKALADYLGHADPGFTLRTYTHLMPTTEDRARQAIDRALGNTNADRSNASNAHADSVLTSGDR
jgi:integrase